MTPAALALVIAAALLHAAWNLVAKKTGGDHRFAFIAAVQLAVIWAPVALWVGWSVVPLWGWIEWAAVAASAAVHLAYFTTLLTGYRKADLTVVYPVARGVGPLVTVLGAVLLLGERPSVVALLGVAGIVGGVFVLAGGPALWQAAHDATRRARLHAGLRYGAATGLMIAGYTLIDGWAVKVLLMSPILVDWFGNALRIPLLAPWVLRDVPALREAWRTQWKGALVVATFGPVAYVLVLYAAQIAPLSHVAPAREVSMLFAALLGGRLLGEGDRWLRIAGACCIAAGVALLALG